MTQKVAPSLCPQWLRTCAGASRVCVPHGPPTAVLCQDTSTARLPPPMSTPCGRPRCTLRLDRPSTWTPLGVFLNFRLLPPPSWWCRVLSTEDVRAPIWPGFAFWAAEATAADLLPALAGNWPTTAPVAAACCSRPVYRACDGRRRSLLVVRSMQQPCAIRADRHARVWRPAHRVSRVPHHPAVCGVVRRPRVLCAADLGGCIRGIIDSCRAGMAVVHGRSVWVRCRARLLSWRLLAVGTGLGCWTGTPRWPARGLLVACIVARTLTSFSTL